KSGSKVSIQAEGNQINLIVDKKLDARPVETEFAAESRPSSEQYAAENSTQPVQLNSSNAPLKFSTPVDDLPSITTVPATSPAPAGNSAAQPAVINPAATIVPQHDGTAP